MASTKAFTQDTTAEETATAYSDQITDKVILLTGISPNTIASAAALAIASHKPRLLILASRNVDRLAAVESAIKEVAPNAPIRLLRLDLDSIADAKRAGKEVLGYKEPLNVVINSAGIMAAPYRTTKDGIESQFAIAHVGSFAFTQTLLPKLLASRGRVVNVTSSGHAAGGYDYMDLETAYQHGKKYDKWVAYAAATSGRVLYAQGLAHHYGKQGLQSYSVHPGTTESGIFQHLDDEGKQIFVQMGAMTPDFKPIKGGSPYVTWKSLSGCAAGLIVAAFAPDLEAANGAYLIDCQIANDQRAPHATGDHVDKMWDLTERLAGV